MKRIYRKARGALIVASGVAVATAFAGTCVADGFTLSPLSPDGETLQTNVQLVGYNEFSLLDSEGNDADEDDTEDDDASIEDRFKTLEEKLEDVAKTLEGVANKADNPSIVVSGSSNSTMKVSGRVHVDGWGFDLPDADRAAITRMNDDVEPKDRIGFRRIRFGVAGKVKDNMLYKIEMEFAGGNESEFRDVYLGWDHLPFVETLLLGNQKRPYGLDHLNSSRYNVFIERPFVIEGFNQDARRLGLCAYGESDDESWNWRYGVFNQRNIQGLGNYIDDPLQMEVAGRLSNTFWYDEISGGRGYANWGISGTHADTSPNATNGNEARFRTRPEARSSNRWLNTDRIDGADYYNLLGLEGVLNVGPLQIVGEYQNIWMERKDGFANTRFDGGYVYVAYWLTGEYTPWERYSGTIDRTKPIQNFWLVNLCDGGCDGGWGAWQIAGRYSTADFSDEDVQGGIGNSFTFGLNWWWNPNARMQFNYINGRITDRETEDGGQVFINDGTYNIFGTRFMIDF